MAKKKNKKNQTAGPVLSSGFEGHRDLAELLSSDYGLILPKLEIPVIDAMFDMDQLTSYLQELDARALDEATKDRWVQGFVMGIIHQAVHQTAINLIEEEEFDGDDDFDDDDDET